VDGHEAYLPLARECLAGGLGGVLLSGGGDVGADPQDKPGLPESLARQDKARDRWEAALFVAALEAGLPVLGVCRGLQLINVALGGTLWEDISSMVGDAVEHRQRHPRTRPGHPVRLVPGSLAARLSGAEAIDVNTGHHQAVRLLGEGLAVTGVSEDGLAEVLEMPGRPFVLAVQWHPEGLARSDPRALALFKGLADAAREALASGAGEASGRDAESGRDSASGRDAESVREGYGGAAAPPAGGAPRPGSGGAASRPAGAEPGARGER
jgi:putative glutamine amidotransferase